MTDHQQGGRNWLLRWRSISVLIEALLPLGENCDERSLRLSVDRLGLVVGPSNFVTPLHLPDDVPPQGEVFWIWSSSIVFLSFAAHFKNWNARNFHDAALNRINQTKVAHKPWEWRALWMSAAADIKRCRRHVDGCKNARAHTLCAAAEETTVVDAVKAIKPDAGLVLLPIKRFLVFDLIVSTNGVNDSWPPTMMSFVVENQNWQSTCKFTNSVKGERLAVFFALLYNSVGITTFEILTLAAKDMPVCHQYLARVHVLAVTTGHHIKLVVIVVEFFRLQYLQSILDRQIWCNNEHATGKLS